MVTVFPTFGDIRVGEPDANVEYYSSLRKKESPIYISSFYSMPSFPMDSFIDGDKFIIYGQKGTGKTTIMRFLENRLKDSFQTEFVVFKRSFNEERDLNDFSNIPLMIDDDNIFRYRHFMHSIKRILIFILLKQTFEKDPNLEESTPEAEKNWMSKLRDSTVADIIGIGFDSVKSIFLSAGVDSKALSSGSVLLDAGKAVKRSNDDLLKFAVRRMKRLGTNSCIFLDEIHFAYRSKEALHQDAMLVRDCILAAHSLNDRFAEEGVNARIYSAVRSEYLEHPVISSADINQSIESVGCNLTWSTFPENRNHPLFRMLFERFKASIGQSLSYNDFLKIYFGSMTPETFLTRTWAKPRDLVRFFKCAKELYPDKSQLSSSEQNAVWRQYAQTAWNELKSASSAFLTPASIERMEDIFRREIPLVIDKHRTYTFPQFQRMIRPIYQESMDGSQNFYSENHFADLMYIIGVFGTRREAATGHDIVQTYHRGNRSYHRDGIVMIHPAVLKAFG